MKSRLDVRGVSVPTFFYGTAWKEDKTTQLTRLALQSGFVAIDTANQRKHYHEAGVGEALSIELGRGLGTRETLFLQTKFTYARGQDHRLPYDATADAATQVDQSLASSLEHLGTTYVDSLLLHGPETAGVITATDGAVWRAMEKHHRAGTARLLGVSNVSVKQLAALHAQAEVKPAFVQNRCYARDSWDRDVRAFCAEHGLVYQAFSLLTANAKEIKHRDVETLARKLAITVPQLVFAFAIARGMIPLTGTSSVKHMVEDLRAREIAIEEKDLRTVEWIALA